MEKLEGYEEVQALTGEFEILPAAGYICKIRDARIDKTTTSKKVLIITFDIDEGDHAGFYQRKFDSDSKTQSTEAKWKGVYRQMLEGEKATAYFKGLITTLENSNPKFKWDWDEKKLKGLKFGGLFGREEFLLNGESKFATKIRYIRSVEKIEKGDFEIPKDKLLPKQGEAFEDFTTKDFNEDDLPF